MSALPGPVTPSRLRRAGDIASDVLIATAIMWAPPLLLGAVAAVVRLLLDAL